MLGNLEDLNELLNYRSTPWTRGGTNTGQLSTGDPVTHFTMQFCTAGSGKLRCWGVIPAYTPAKSPSVNCPDSVSEQAPGFCTAGPPHPVWTKEGSVSKTGRTGRDSMGGVKMF